MTRVAIIFDNFGPYHLARLEAAARVCDLLAIEINDRCLEHGWTRENGVVRFQTVTLTAGAGGGLPGIRGWSGRLRTVLAEFKPQVVFLPGWSCAAAFVAQHWGAVHLVPSVVMSESNSWDETRVASKEWVKRRLAWMYSAALVGGTTHKHYMKQLGMPSERIFLGYDAVDNDYFATKAQEVRNQRLEVRSRYGLPEHFFLASARFVEKKNLPHLIRAYARYRDLASKTETNEWKAKIWNLVVLGDGPLKSDLCALISEFRLDACVHLPGFKQYSELPIYYGLADAFVHASTTEQWGLVVNEAMASGLPVLVSDRCGCATDLVEVARDGFIFDSRDNEQIAQLMLKIANMKPEELDQLGQA